MFRLETPKSSKNYISLEEKLEIIRLRDTGMSWTLIGRNKGMNESSVRTIYRRKEKLKQQASTTNPSQTNAVFMDRTPTMENTERLLSLWVLDLEQRGIAVGKSQIQTKARSLFLTLKGNLVNPTTAQSNESFVASNGWFENFKRRHEIKNVKLAGEAKSADLNAAKEYPAELQKLIEEGNYSEDQIFNVGGFFLHLVLLILFYSLFTIQSIASSLLALTCPLFYHFSYK